MSTPPANLVQIGWVVVAPRRSPVPFQMHLRPSADKYAAGMNGSVKPAYMLAEAA